MGNFSVVYSWNNLYRIKRAGEAGEAGEEKKVFCKKKIG